MGGAAILLSNKWWHRWNAKYQLLHTVRVHKGANDTAFYSVYQEEDEKGCRGVALSKELMQVVKCFGFVILLSGRWRCTQIQLDNFGTIGFALVRTSEIFRQFFDQVNINILLSCNSL
jgi:hypothetical protein